VGDSRHSQKISERSVHKFLSYLADTNTDKQTNKVWQNITSLAEVKIAVHYTYESACTMALSIVDIQLGPENDLKVIVSEGGDKRADFKHHFAIMITYSS